MIKPLNLIVIALFIPLTLCAQSSKWEFSAEGTLYILPDETYLNPNFSADRNHLHLEARYNYEDRETVSMFAGYNFQTGDSIKLNVTPMIGGVFGNSDGIAPGYLFELNWKKWNISSEGEYFFSSEEKESNFFYCWSEVAYSPAEWIWFGLAGQRTRAYKTDLEIQRGFLLGVGKGNFSFTGYIMNLGWDDVFGIIAAQVQF